MAGWPNFSFPISVFSIPFSCAVWPTLHFFFFLALDMILSNDLTFLKISFFLGNLSPSSDSFVPNNRTTVINGGNSDNMSS